MLKRKAAILENTIRKFLKQQQFFLLTALEIRQQQYFGEHDIFMLVISCQEDNWEIADFRNQVHWPHVPILPGERDLSELLKKLKGAKINHASYFLRFF